MTGWISPALGARVQFGFNPADESRTAIVEVLYLGRGPEMWKNKLSMRAELRWEGAMGGRPGRMSPREGQAAASRCPRVRGGLGPGLGARHRLLEKE